MTYIHLMPDSNTADLNRHEHEQAQRDKAHEKALADQKAAGIDAVAEYKADLLKSREELNELLQAFLDSGNLADVAYIASRDRDETTYLFTAILDQLAQAKAEAMASDHGGLYKLAWIDTDMDYQKSIMSLEDYKKELAE